MPATNSSASAAASSGENGSAKPSENRSWQLDVSVKSEEDLVHSIVHLAGKRYHDNPYWTAVHSIDARGMGPLTWRFTSEMKPSLVWNISWQDKAPHEIWTRIKALLPDEQTRLVLPTIVFSDTLLVNGARSGVIDLVCSTKRTLDALNQLKDIHIAGVRNDTHVFSRTTCTSFLPGSILTLQCLGLPIDSLNPLQLLTAFRLAAQSVGTVLGMAKIVIDSKQWQVSQQFSGQVRVYCEIDDEKMAVPWAELVLSLPTHLRINGFPYPLTYPSRELHRHDVYSKNYTVGPRDEVASRNDASSDKRSRGTNETAESSSQAAKKMKCSEEGEEEEEELVE